MARRISRSFFHRPTLTVAKELLGQILIRKIGKRKWRGKIVETEAYCGPNDLASHASRGRTQRNDVMFGNPGVVYVYMIYGMYNCLNIVTEEHGYPAAVLIRAVEPIEQIVSEKKTTNGPGKLCKYFQIDRSLNKEDLIRSKKLWIEFGEHIASRQMIRRPRIGVDYAGLYKDKLWRFYIKNNWFVSKK